MNKLFKFKIKSLSLFIRSSLLTPAIFPPASPSLSSFSHFFSHLPFSLLYFPPSPSLPHSFSLIPSLPNSFFIPPSFLTALFTGMLVRILPSQSAIKMCKALEAFEMAWLPFILSARRPCDLFISKAMQLHATTFVACVKRSIEKMNMKSTKQREESSRYMYS